MTNEILFSLVIPTYNRASFIGKAIESVLAQTYTNFQLIIVDDGSTDNTEEVVKQYSDPRITYHKKQNAERGAARNTGTSIATGLYVNFFDSDDLLYPNHLEEALKTISTYYNPEMFHLGYDIKTPDGKLLGKVNMLKGDIGPKLVTGNFLSCNGVFIRRDIARQLPFNEDRRLAAFEDWQLWLRISSRFPVYYNNTITSTVVNHSQRSVLDTKKDGLINREKVLISSLKEDKQFMSTFGHKLMKLQASLYTYVSLHLALTRRYKKEAATYLLKGITLNPEEVLKRRFLAILKHIIQ